MFKKLASFAFAAALLAVAVPASAQFRPTPANPSESPTYRTSIVALVTAASATDFLTITGSATKTVVVKRIMCSGIGSTAGTADLQIVKRSTANTGGTSTTLTGVQLDSNDAAPTAVVRAYTVNPSALGTAVGSIGAAKIGLPLAATGATMQQLTFDTQTMPRTKPIVLRGVAQTLALNGNAATLAAGASLACTVEWTEV